jgi:ankyrin repeat protein
MRASYHNKYDIVKLLVHSNANVNLTSEIYDMTSLMYVSRDGYIDIIKLLIKNKADIHKRNIDRINDYLNRY